ncbi:MAG TPA: hypothetical protein VKY59_12780 [Spirillospora sp.]|nr:hypothetical protein [Spirillospora sp.]
MRKIIGITALPLTWLLLFYTFVLLTTFILVPWDTAVVRPEPGTWQRTVNDFFETAPGQYSFALLLTGLSAVLAWSALRRQPVFALRLALVNVIFAALLFAVFMLAAVLNNAVFPYPAGVLYDPTYHGFHRSVIPGMAVMLACALWLGWQRRAAGG